MEDCLMVISSQRTLQAKISLGARQAQPRKLPVESIDYSNLTVIVDYVF